VRDFLLRRILSIVAGVLALSVLVFVLVRLAPGDAVSMWIGSEGTMSPEVQNTLRNLFGLDDPAYIQYAKWLGNLARGDLGYSFRSSLPVVPQILQALPITIELAILATLISAVVALPLGILSAVRRNSSLDLLARLLGLIGLSMPNFWVAVIIILVSATVFHWLPALIYIRFSKDPAGNLTQMAMPAVALALPLMGVVMRMTRSAMLEVLNQDYIRTARAKGIGELQVQVRHALRNALIPIVTIIGVQLGRLLGGAVIVEQIFGVPGVGSLLVSAISGRDYPMVQGTLLFMGLLFMLVQFAVDLSYAYLDPRIRIA
jgi:peptide/nickel transport system permease protein